MPESSMQDKMNTATDSYPGINTSIITSTNQTDITIFPEYQAATILWKFCLPVILLLGVFGNITTVVVMHRTKGHNSSLHLLLMALAVADLFLLLIGGLESWLSFSFGVEVRTFHAASCKLHSWLRNSLGTLSAWLISCVTVQRMIAVKWPHKVKLMCSQRKTWIVIAGITFTACAFHTHCLFMFRITADNNCTYRSLWYEVFTTTIYGWVDLCISSLLPFVCLIVCDIVLSLTLFKGTYTECVSVHTISHDHSHSRRTVASKTTVLVLALSCAFVILTLPICVFLLWNSYMSVQLRSSPRLLAKSHLAFAVTSLLWYTNSAINFLLYCFTGAHFRKEFLSLVCCGHQRYSVTSVKSVTLRTSRDRDKDACV